MVEVDQDGVTWDRCFHCGDPIFRHYAWSHQGGTPPQDHEAAPESAVESSAVDLRLLDQEEEPW